MDHTRYSNERRFKIAFQYSILYTITRIRANEPYLSIVFRTVHSVCSKFIAFHKARHFLYVTLYADIVR